MQEIEPIPSIPLFEQVFSSMTIAGEVGIAMSHETADLRRCVSIGRTGNECKKCLITGKPDRAPKTQETVITPEEYESLAGKMSVVSPRHGIVAADVLDGEMYVLRWVRDDSELRFMLCNPDELDSAEYQRLGRAMKAAIEFAFST